MRVGVSSCQRPEDRVRAACPRLAWLILLSALLALAGRVRALDLPAQPQVAMAMSLSCAGMDMAAASADQPGTHQDRPGRHGTCGVDCPMHCGGTLAPWTTLAVARPSYRLVLQPSGSARLTGWPPTPEHGPPRPRA